VGIHVFQKIWTEALHNMTSIKEILNHSQVIQGRPSKNHGIICGTWHAQI
jgi:hypothetical protein